MTTTITVNISGNAFTIEEEAYRMLESYLNAIRSKIKMTSEANEVMSDIEARIAELFRATCPSTREVVTCQMVNEMISVMGKPDDFSNDETEENAQEPGNSSSQPASEPIPTRKKLYRDSSTKRIGGVCAGLAAYFNMEVSLVRLIFVISLFFGINPLLYIVLWIVLPEAVTMAQRMEMMGYVPTASGTKSDDYAAAYAQTNRSASSSFDSAINGIGRVFAIVFGFGIALVSFLLFSALFMALFFSQLFPNHANEGLWQFWQLPHWILPGTDLQVALIAIMLVAGIPLLVLFYVGVKLLFNIRKSPKWIAIVAFTLWIGGLVLGVVSIINFGSLITNKAVSFTHNTLSIGNYKTIYLEPLTIESNNDWEMTGKPSIYIYKSDVARIEIVDEAWGAHNKKRFKHIDKETYRCNQTDSLICIQEKFHLINEINIKPRKIKVSIYVPSNIQLNINPLLKDLIKENNLDSISVSASTHI